MGKTKTKIMDDSVVTEEAKKTVGKKLGRQDDLVERLKAELADVGTTSEDSSEGKLSPNVASSRREAKGDERTRAKSDLAQGAEGVSEQESEIADQSTKPTENKPKKPQKQGKSKPRSKKYQESSKELDKTQTYPLAEAIELIKKQSYSKFVGTLEAHINTISTNIRGLVSLPFASGKKLTILAFGPTSLQSELSGIEGIVIGDESTIEEINKGKVNFDLVVTTPEWMPRLAKVARILGPRGLMPNPKNGTITEDLKKAVQGFQGGKTEYKTESKAPVIHIALGKLNQPTEELSANIKTLLQVLGKSRVKKVTLSPTMGPAVKLDLSSI